MPDSDSHRRCHRRRRFARATIAVAAVCIAASTAHAAPAADAIGAVAGLGLARLVLILVTATMAAMYYALQTAASANVDALDDTKLQTFERQCWAAGFLFYAAFGVLVIEASVNIFHATPVVGAMAGGAVMIVFQWVVLENAARNLALRHGDALSASLAGPARVIASPLRALVIQMLRATNDRELTREEARLRDARNRQLRLLPHVQDVERFVDEEAVEMIDSVRSFIESTASDVMTPRTEIEGVPIELPREELIVRLRATNYSRVVVYERTLDTIVGSLMAKEVLLNPQSDPGTFLRPPLLVPRTTRLPELLRTMQKQRAHLAIVVDEYGGTAGLVTLHDLFEAILGAQIADEHDADELWIVRLEDGGARLNGRVEVWEVNEDFDLQLNEDEARTIGGYIGRHLGRIPEAGDRLDIDGGVFVVEEVAQNRVQCLRLERVAPTGEALPAQADAAPTAEDAP